MNTFTFILFLFCYFKCHFVSFLRKWQDLTNYFI